MVNWIDILSIVTTITGILMSGGYFTQTWKIWKNKSSKNVSPATYYIFGVGVAVWLIYGIAINNWVVIISNVVAEIGALAVLISYHIYK